MLCCTARCAGRVICTISLYLCACLPPVEKSLNSACVYNKEKQSRGFPYSLEI